jgi:hypothetical protein
MRGLLEEAHAHLEQATKVLRAVAADAYDEDAYAIEASSDALADKVDDLASRVSNLVREVRP